MTAPDFRRFLLGAVALAGVVALVIAGPIAQDPAYHHFADSRTIAGVANFWNVLSNLPFVIAGGVGLWRYPRLAEPETRAAYLLLCLGAMLVGLGSAYYHLAPSNASLLWDRQPMTVTFMALLSLLLGERVVVRRKHAWLAALVTTGIAAALYWHWTEAAGHGDLRPYVLVQFLPVVLMPLILLMFPRRYLEGHLLLQAIGLYFVAKVLEHYDERVLALTGVLGGHALKHLAAAFAVLCIVLAVPARPRERPCVQACVE